MHTNPRKIKGGRWTVFRFCLVSIAYTSAWLAVSSDLKFYREEYGPRILLLLNVAYYAPGIPLLIISSFLDVYFEQTFGIAKTILVRLLVGLVGYGCVSAAFPFLPHHLTWLLLSTLSLGAFSGIAFSASYQLVSRFANKNVISLGLGCTLSGPLVLLMQLAYHMNGSATAKTRILLYESITVIVAAGLWATVSLLLRHWNAIEASAIQDSSEANDNEALAEPLLLLEEQGTETDQQLAAPLGGSPRTSGNKSSSNLLKHPSLPPLIAYNAMEPYQTYLNAEDEWPSYLSRRQSSSGDGSVRRINISLDRAAADGINSSPSNNDNNTGNHTNNINNNVQVDMSTSSTSERHSSPVTDTLQHIWPALIAVGIQSGIALTLFPFFTYLPSSGLLGEELARYLFFWRIFTDIGGRYLPRMSTFQPSSIWTVFTVALIKLAAEPLFFLYLKSPEYYHSDVLAVVYIGAMWMAGGYVNTASNMIAPILVDPQLKSTAAGLMAIVYQAGHFVGLALAALLVRLLYGDL